MKIARNILIGLSAVPLALTPAIAAASPRASQSAEDSNELGGGTGLFFIVAALVVVALGIVAFNDDDEPVSP